MKRYLALLLAACLLCGAQACAMSFGEFIQQPEYSYERYLELQPWDHAWVRADEDQDAPLRAGPGERYDVIGSLPAGESAKYLQRTEVDDLGRSWDWVVWDEIEGWVCSEDAEFYFDYER